MKGTPARLPRQEAGGPTRPPPSRPSAGMHPRQRLTAHRRLRTHRVQQDVVASLPVDQPPRAELLQVRQRLGERHPLLPDLEIEEGPAPAVQGNALAT